MNRSAIRINARLLGEDARRFVELQKASGNRPASDLLRDALREYYAAHVRPRPSALALMRASGFIGGGNGPVDLSANYKTYLADAFEENYPRRVNEPESPGYNTK